MIKRIVGFYKRHFWPTEKYGRAIGVQIGHHCILGRISFGTEPYLISIGNHVQITDGVKFLTHGGGWVFRQKYPDFDTFGKIKIGNNVYIGNNVLILPGVHIGNNVLIGAGAVVTKSVSDYSIVGGNPGKVLGSTIELEKRMLPYNVKTKGLNPQAKKDFLLSLPEDKFIKK